MVRANYDGLMLVKLLKKQGYSFDQIAKFSGVSKRTLINWYHNVFKPSRNMNELARLRINANMTKIRRIKPAGYIMVYEQEGRTK